MISEIEIVEALINDHKIASIQLKYNYIGENALYSTNHNSHCEIHDIYCDEDLENITFTPIYHPTPDICVGDLVWVEGKGKMFLRSLSAGGFTASVDPKSSTRMFFENKTRISLLKKAEVND